MPEPLELNLPAVMIAVLLASLLALGPGALPATPDHPNVVLIITDDMDVDLFDDAVLAEVMPTVYERLRLGGTKFVNYQTTTPLCGPSRASSLRGQYAHNTHILNNNATDGQAGPDGLPLGGFEAFWQRGYVQDELGVWMRAAGYHTVLVGKYHNNNFPAGSGMATPDLPGWADVRASYGGRYFGTHTYTNGVIGRYPYERYRTDAEGEQLLDALDARPTGQPFFAYFAPFAPHYGTGDMELDIFPDRAASLFEDWAVPRAPNFNETDVSDKAPHIAEVPLLTEEEVADLDHRYRVRARSLRALDERIADLFAYLDANGLADDTIVLFGSDNGFAMGHHRLHLKQNPYVRSTSVPLLVAGPGIPAGAVRAELVGNIDLAPTLLEVAGAPMKPFFDGASFAPLFRGEAVPWREAILLEQYSATTRFGVRVDVRFEAVRRASDVYIAWGAGGREYYDLTTDPHQLENGYDALTEGERSAFEAQIAELAAVRTDKHPASSTTLTGAAGWRALASPEPTTVGAFLADFWTQGFPGAANPAGDCTVFTFDEGAASLPMGWACVAGATAPIAAGEGLMVYVFEDDDATTPTVVDHPFPKRLAASRAVAPSGDFAFPVAFTDDARPPRQKGWNLLGAPFGTAFRWDGVTRSGVGATVYVYDPAHRAEGGYRSYTLDGSSGSGSLAGGVVPPFQAFFVQAHAASPGLVLPEGGAQDGRAVYGRREIGDPPPPPPTPLQSSSSGTAIHGQEVVTAAIRGVAPNPTSGHTSVEWMLAEAGPARLTVVDLLGREVAVLADGVVAAGVHRADLAGGRLAPGVYVVRLVAGLATEARRLVVAR